MNNSGIHPTGRLVLVLIDPVPTTHGGVVALTDQAIEQNQLAQIRGTLIEAGPTAWKQAENQEGDEVPIGSRIIFRRYAGELVTGSDGIMYRIMNDKDIYATFTRE